MTTDKGVAQYNETTNAFYHYSKADGLLRQDGAIGTLLVGNLFTVLFPDGAETLDIQANVWQTRSVTVTQTSDRNTRVNVFSTINAQEPYDFVHRQFAGGGYATAVGGVGVGQQMGNGRPTQWLGVARLRTGRQFRHSRPSVQDRIPGQQDRRIARGECCDKLQYRLVEGLDRPLLLQGARVKLSTPDAESRSVQRSTPDSAAGR